MSRRLQFYAAVAVLVVPIVALALTRSEAPLLQPSDAGTFRLDTLLGQAQVAGMEAADIDPATFIVHEVDASQPEIGIVAASDAGKVERDGNVLRLTGSGPLVPFKIALPEAIRDQVSMVAVKVRGHGVKDVALFVGDPGVFTGAGMNMLQNFVRGLNITPPGAPAGAPGGAPGGNNPAPNPGPAGVNLDGFNPMNLLKSMTVTLQNQEEWQTIARSRASLLPAGMGQGLFGGGQRGGGNGRRAPSPPLTLALIDAPDGASLDVEFVHVLDPRAEFAHAPAGTTVLDRDNVLQSGMFMNTPCEASYRLVAPADARLTTQIAAIDAQPFVLAVHVTAKGTRKTVLEKHFASGTAIEPVSVDLAAYVGQEITLSLEVLEDGGPTVAFLLQPMVAGERPAGRRNAVLYFCDTLRADGLSCYGNPRGTTPALDDLAKQGVRFDRCFSQGSWTYVSMPSSLSSLPPSVNGVKMGFEKLADSVTTVAEAFRAHGYLTVAFIRNDIVGRTTHTDQGFDFLFSAAAVTTSDPRPPSNIGMAGQMMGGGFESGSSRAIYERFAAWLEQHDSVPLFVYLHAVDPHEPYEPEQADWEKYLTATEKLRYDDEQRKLGIGAGNIVGNVQVMQLGGGGGMTLREQWTAGGVDADAHVKAQRALYDAEVAYFDRHMQKVLDLLDTKKMADNTVFSFNADHGEEFLDHGYGGHGHSVYAELNRVPWILRAPGLPAGKVIEDNVANLDLVPTLLGLCGFAPAEGMLGRDLSQALMAGGEIPPARIVTEMWSGIGGGGFGGQGAFAVMEGRWKTIVRRPPPRDDNRAATRQGLVAVPPRKLPDFEVYDLQADLADSKSVYNERKDYALGVQKRLDAWLSEMDQLRAKYGADGPTSMTAEAAANLRALGYLK